MGHDTPLSGTDQEALADELVAVRCQLGEQTGFADLVERWHQPLWTYIRRVSGSDDVAAETLQDVWLRVLRGIAALREPRRLRPWLFGIARRAVMDRLREKYAEPEAVDAATVDLPAADDEHELRQEIGFMHEELARMPVVEREVLVLFYLEELSLTQLAEVLAVPVGTVKSRLFRARRMLRRQLTGKGIRP